MKFISITVDQGLLLLHKRVNLFAYFLQDSLKVGSFNPFLPFDLLWITCHSFQRPQESRCSERIETVESVVNGDSKRTNERGPFLVGHRFSITNISANSKPKSERLEMPNRILQKPQKIRLIAMPI
jgi:hypothetical protein